MGNKTQNFEIPESLKRVLSKLPTPEALEVIEDLGKGGKVDWVVDNNNNTKGITLTTDELTQKMSTLSSEQIKQILKILEQED